MALLLRLSVDGVDDRLAELSAGALLRWERGSAVGGPYVEQGTKPLVAGQGTYEILDPTGTTAHWYRFRLSNAGNTIAYDYSEPFQGGVPDAYATLDDLRELLQMPDDSRDNLLLDLLRDASAHITDKCSRDFYRHPAISGTEVRVLDGTDTNVLRVDAGIISLDTVELAAGTGQSYSTLSASDWILSQPVEAGSQWLYLSDAGGYQKFHGGFGTVRLTGAFGFESVPLLVRRATLDLAREWYRQGPGGGGPVGVTQFGTPIFGGMEPKTVRDAIDKYALRLPVA